MKTARGKTIIVARLISHFNTSTLILCHNIRNAHRTAEKIRELCQEDKQRVACITSKSKESDVKEITVTTHTWFVQNYEKYKGKFSQIIYDECDYNLSFPSGSTFDGCMSSCIINSDCNIIWGLTWTPYKDILWQRPIATLFGAPIQMPDQENNGYNIIPHIKQIVYSKAYWYVRTTRSELRQQMVNDQQRHDTQIKSIQDNLGKYNIVLVEQVEEAKWIYEDLKNKYKELWIPVILFHWQLKVRELREQQELFAASRPQANAQGTTPYIIIGTIDMVWRWEDIPELDTIFFFAPVKFKGNVVQAVGRWLRVVPGKWEVVVYDWLDMPLLKKQATEREKTYKIEYWEDVLIDKVIL